jgi:hypothetical protein
MITPANTFAKQLSKSVFLHYQGMHAEDVHHWLRCWQDKTDTEANLYINGRKLKEALSSRAATIRSRIHVAKTGSLGANKPNKPRPEKAERIEHTELNPTLLAHATISFIIGDSSAWLQRALIYLNELEGTTDA